MNQNKRMELKRGDRWLRLLDSGGDVKRKIIGIYLLLASVNLLVWLGAVAAFRGFPLLIGTSVIAYTFGLRHAVDAEGVSNY